MEAETSPHRKVRWSLAGDSSGSYTEKQKPSDEKHCCHPQLVHTLEVKICISHCISDIVVDLGKVMVQVTTMQAFHRFYWGNVDMLNFLGQFFPQNPNPRAISLPCLRSFKCNREQE